jgi:hypothetical protein
MSRVKDLFEAYEEGKQVAQEGWMCMNPYEEGSYMKEYWDRGYRDEEEDEMPKGKNR